MPSPSTASFSLKLERAREHLEAFETEAKTWLESNPYTITDEPDPEPPGDPRDVYSGTQRRRFRVSRVEPVPTRLSLILGDCVHNLRASLDHLTLALGLANKPAMSESERQGSEFPVFFLKPMDTNTETKKIGCLLPGAKRAIKALQPHHRGTTYRDDPLWQVHEFDRIDKHRALTLSTMVTEPWFGFTIRDDWNVRKPDGLPFMHNIGGELIPNAVIIRYAARPANPYREVKLEPHVPGQVAFAKGGTASLEPVIPTLRALCDFVGQDVIAKLSQFF